MKRIILIFIGLILFLLGLLILITHFYSDEAENTVVKELNRHLDFEVSVSDIKFSLFENFPNASIVFTDIQTNEKINNSSGSLLKAKKFAVLFNIWSLISKNYQIEKILIKDAFLNLIVYEDGTRNYDLFESTGQPQGDNLQFNLNKVILQNVQVLYIDYPSNQEYFFKSEKSMATGAFSSSNYQLTVSGLLFSKHIKSGKSVILKDRELSLEMTMFVDKINSLFEIKTGSLKVAGLSFSFSGNVMSRPKSNYLDINIISDKSKLSSFYDLIPEEYIIPLQDYSINGQLNFKAKIQGDFTGDSLPFLSFKFGMENGIFKHKTSKTTLENVSFSGEFQNGKSRSKKSFIIRLDGFKSKLKDGFVNGDLVISNFVQPDIFITTHSGLDLKQLTSIYPIDVLNSISGNVALNLQFRNKLKSFRKFTISDFITSKTAGSMVIKDMELKVNTSPLSFNNINGEFQFSNKDLIVQRLSGEVSGNDFMLKGNFNNIIAYTFLTDEHLNINATLSSKGLDLDELLQHQPDHEGIEHKLSFSDNLNFEIDINKIDHFNFKKFNASNIYGKIKLKNRKLFIDNARFSTMEGSARLAGIIDGQNQDKFKVNCNAKITDVNITKLFYEFGNFGQNNITTENLKGTVNAEVFYKSLLSTKLTVDPGSVYTYADIVINNGELIGYESLYKLSRFIKKEELEHIKFSTLKNNIEIKDEVVYIPEMDISSNTLDIKLNGSHSFQNDIDYRIQILMSQLFSGNNKNNESIEGIIIDDKGEGRTMLPIRMVGKADNPDIRWDTKTVRKKISSDLKEEKNELKEVFREEFKWLHKKDNDDSQRSKDSILIQKEGQNDFIIEWEKPLTDTLNTEQKSNINTVIEEETKSDKEDFIIIWDEDEDSTNEIEDL